MRQDIQKVVCERQRSGSRERSLKTGIRLNLKQFFNNSSSYKESFEDFRMKLIDLSDGWIDSDIIGGVDYGSYDSGPSRVSISRRRAYGWDCKRHNDNTNPLQRFLCKNVGRLWNDVFSEICAIADHRSATDYDFVIRPVQQWLVAHDILMYEEKPYQTRWGRRDFWWEFPYSGLYVHPETGILCEYKRAKYQPQPKPVTSIHWYDHTWFQLEVFKDRNLECKCVHFKVPVVEEKNNRLYYRHLDKPAVCIHGNEPTSRPIWFVYTYAYHLPDEVYRVIHWSDYEASRYSLTIGETHTVYYRDVPDLLATAITQRKKVANRKELKLINEYLCGTI